MCSKRKGHYKTTQQKQSISYYNRLCLLSFFDLKLFCYLVIMISSSSAAAFVSPLLSKGLSKLFPQLSILYYSSLGYSCKFLNLASPSFIRYFSTSFIVIRVPVSQSLRPSIVVHPSYMSCSPPFLLFYHLNDVFFFEAFL